MYNSLGNPVPVQTAYGALNDYLEPDYVTGQVLPCELMLAPFSMVIDLDDRVVLGMDEGSSFQMSLEQILTLIEQAND